MAIDEFGREIPGGRSDLSPSRQSVTSGHDSPSSRRNSDRDRIETLSHGGDMDSNDPRRSSSPPYHRRHGHGHGHGHHHHNHNPTHSSRDMETMRYGDLGRDRGNYDDEKHGGYDDSQGTRRTHSPSNRGRSRSTDYNDKGNNDNYSRYSGSGIIGGNRSHSPPRRFDNRRGNNHSPPIMRRGRAGSRNSRSFSDDWGSDHRGGQGQGQGQGQGRDGPRRSGGGGDRRGGGGGGGRELHRRRHRNPVNQYVDEPMLCEYLWKELYVEKKSDQDLSQEEERMDTEEMDHNDGHGPPEPPTLADDVGDGTDNGTGTGTGTETETENENETKTETGTSAEADAGAGTGLTNKNNNTEAQLHNHHESEKSKDKKDTDDKEEKSKDLYEQYKKDYCLDYIRSFFNSHLDDEWFKLRYSPFHRKAVVTQMRNRAIAEASTIKEEITKLADENNPNGPTGADSFIREARLGIGKKPTVGDMNKKYRSGNKRGYSALAADDMNANTNAPSAGMEGNERPMENDVLFRNPVPSSHVLTGHTHCALEITDVPPYVTDSQLSHAVAEHSSSPPLRICSTSVGMVGSSKESLGTGRASQKYCNSLSRSVWAIFMNEEAKEEMVENLSKANFEDNRISDRKRSMEIGIIPTIDAPKSNKTFELDIDCSDAFGRTEIDADGHGGAPNAIPLDPDDMDRDRDRDRDSDRDRSNSNTKDRATAIPKVMLRKATVYVKTDSQPGKHNISVLSAAVSSKERIPRDKTAALMIARALDTSNSIPSGVQLDDIVELLFPNGVAEKDDNDIEEDVLDVAIAYLRRVHLFSFYNGAQSCCEGDVLSGYYPAGTIHLRLRDADSILQKAKDEGSTLAENSHQQPAESGSGSGMESNKSNSNEDKTTVVTDLLVQRLDDSIAKALEESTTKIGSASIMVNETVDTEALEIETKEASFKQKWLDDHALLDADGRARCSFHFCRKLFKDKTFLFKHLLKKHPEYLAGEQAKIHDSYMMKAWEEEEVRPIPQLMVDCGDRFGLVASTVSGICPTCPDPYPEMYKKDQEKRARQEKEERERRERIQRRNQKYDAQHYDEGPYAPNKKGNDGDGIKLHSNMGMGGNSGGFVDVDDIQDEKVKLSFENVALPLPPPKKKKKKKKIL